MSTVSLTKYHVLFYKLSHKLLRTWLFGDSRKRDCWDSFQMPYNEKKTKHHMSSVLAWLTWLFKLNTLHWRCHRNLFESNMFPCHWDNGRDQETKKNSSCGGQTLLFDQGYKGLQTVCSELNLTCRGCQRLVNNYIKSFCSLSVVGVTTAAVCVYPSRVSDAVTSLKATYSILPVASG